jgi:hypothetical protein
MKSVDLSNFAGDFDRRACTAPSPGGYTEQIGAAVTSETGGVIKSYRPGTRCQSGELVQSLPSKRES